MNKEDILKREGKLELIVELKRRLSNVEQKDCLFPLAGQQYRNNVIKLLDFIEEEIKQKVN